MLNDSAVSAQVVLTGEKHGRRADITLHARGEKFLHGVGESTAWETSLSQALDKIAQQARKVKGKWQEPKRRSVKGEPIAGEAAAAVAVRPAARNAPARPRMPRILRASRQALKAMSVGEAAREIDANGEGVARLPRRRDGRHQRAVPARERRAHAGGNRSVDVRAYRRSASNLDVRHD